MRAYVFTDERLSGHAGQFVWLSIDTERDANAAAVAKFPISAWPSFLVVDPKTEKIVFRQVGSFTAREFAAILDDGRAAMATRKDAAPHEKLLAEADNLYGAGDYEAAARRFGQEGVGVLVGRVQIVTQSGIPPWLGSDSITGVRRIEPTHARGVPRICRAGRTAPARRCRR